MIIQTNKAFFILILGILSGIGAFSIDTYISGFPAIAQDLHVSIAQVSYSLSSFFIGICVGQLFIGPLLDRFGRKKPLIVGMTIYTITSFGAALTPSIELLIGLRFLQALGACVGSVAPRAMVRDSFPIHEMAKIFSLLILILGISPIIAPTVGSYVITAFGWRAVFILQGGMGLFILLLVIFFLPETQKSNPNVSLRSKDIINKFIEISKVPQFYTYALTGAIVSSGVYAYLAGSPLVFMKNFHLSEKEYAYAFGFIAAGLIASSQFNTLVLKVFLTKRIIRTALFIQTFFGICLFVGSLMQWHTLFSILLLSFLFISCQGFSQPNTSALALSPFSKEAGSASALLGALQMGFGALSSALVSLLGNGSHAMTGVMMTCAGIGVLLIQLLQPKIIKN